MCFHTCHKHELSTSKAYCDYFLPHLGQTHLLSCRFVLQIQDSLGRWHRKGGDMRVSQFSCTATGLVKLLPSLIARQVPCVGAPSLGITLDGPRLPRPDGMRLGLEPPKRVRQPRRCRDGGESGEIRVDTRRRVRAGSQGVGGGDSVAPFPKPLDQVDGRPDSNHSTTFNSTR